MKKLTKKMLTAAVLAGLSMGGHQVFAADAQQAAQPADAMDEYRLPDLVVSAARVEESLADGMVRSTGGIGFLGEKEALATPFQAMTFDAAAIDRFAAPNRNILDTLSLDPAVRVGRGATDSTIWIRGIRSNGNAWYINGVPGIAHQKDMSANFIGKVTVISGPAIGVRGTTSGWQENAGGVVDMVSKRAEDRPNRDVKLGLHGRSYVSQTVDIGERIGRDKAWGIRINAMQGQGTLAVENARMWKRDLFINIDHRRGCGTMNLLLGYDYTRERGNGNSLKVPARFNTLPRAPRGSVNLSPAWSEDEYDNYMAVLNYEYAASDTTKFFLNAGYHKENYTSWIQGYNRTLLDMAGNYGPVVASGYGEGYSQWPVAHATKYLGVGVKGAFRLGDWKNDYVLSLDRLWFHRETIGSYGSDPAERYIAAPGNIYESNRTPLPAPLPKKPLKAQYATTMTGWHIVDEVTAPGDKLTLVLGLHGHRGVRARNYSGSSAAEIDAHATCPTYALSYRFTPQLTAYAHHSESFSEGSVVGAGYANQGETIPPAKTRQNEIGVKYMNGGVLQTLSLYRIKMQGTNDVLENSKKYLRIDKEQRYQGLEYSAAGSLTPQLDMIFALNCIDARQTSGQSVLGLPKWSSSMVLVYKPTDRLSVIGRIDYQQAARIRHGANPLQVPAITTLDLGLNYKTKLGREDLLLSLMCSNVFDRKYWYSTPSSDSIFLGRPRTISLSASLAL